MGDNSTLIQRKEGDQRLIYPPSPPPLAAALPRSSERLSEPRLELLPPPDLAPAACSATAARLVGAPPFPALRKHVPLSRRSGVKG